MFIRRFKFCSHLTFLFQYQLQTEQRSRAQEVEVQWRPLPVSWWHPNPSRSWLAARKETRLWSSTGSRPRRGKSTSMPNTFTRPQWKWTCAANKFHFQWIAWVVVRVTNCAWWKAVWLHTFIVCRMSVIVAQHDWNPTDEYDIKTPEQVVITQVSSHVFKDKTQLQSAGPWSACHTDSHQSSWKGIFSKLVLSWTASKKLICALKCGWKGDPRGSSRSRAASTAGRSASSPRCGAPAGSTARPSLTRNPCETTTSACPPTRSCCAVPVVPRRTRPSTSTPGTRLWGTTCRCSSSACLQQSLWITPHLGGAAEEVTVSGEMTTFCYEKTDQRHRLILYFLKLYMLIL